MNGFNPFGKELKTLGFVDLEVLRDVTEGWYVEYKREVPNANAIAKSISAFANTYGGWLFYGIAEKSKEEPVAGAFPGIARSEVDAALQRVRQAVASHVNPTPHFDSHIVWGDAQNELLGPEQGILCIQVPWSPNAPHVHKSGNIYRRVADGSEPRAENDRQVLHQLFHRADDLRASYREWINRDPEFSKAEGKVPYVRILLTADLWDDRNAFLDASIDEIREIMGQTSSVLTAVPFDNVFSSPNGFVARQAKHNDPHRLGLTWRMSRFLTGDIIIPLNFHTPGSPWGLNEALDGYEQADRFIRLLDARGYSTIRVVDLTVLLVVIVGLVEALNKLLARAGWKDGFYVKARILNGWRTTPFLDVPSVIEMFETHGVPMCLNETVTSFPGDDPESFSRVDRFENVDDAARFVLQALCIFDPVALAFGLPSPLESASSGTNNHQELLAAGRRAADLFKGRVTQGN